MDKINAMADFIYNVSLIIRNKRKLNLFEQARLLITYFSMLLFKANKYKNFKFYFYNFDHFLGLFTHRFIHNDYFFQAIRKNPFIIDCGANIGDSILYFKNLYPLSKIIAFEPDKITFSILKNNIRKNNLDNIKIVNKAVSSKNGRAKFYFDSKDLTTGTMSMLPERGHKSSTVVNCVKLSKYITNYVDLLKLDVEGSELNVLEEISKSNKIGFLENIILEYHHNLNGRNDTISRIFQILEKNGFKYQISTELRPPFIKDLFQDILIYAYRSQP